MDLGEKILTLRKEKGLSQERLGELVGVSRQAVSKWEAGQTVPDMENCVALSQALGVTLAQLLEVEGDPGRPENSELTQAQIELVEQMAQRYLEARKKARLRWRWPVILGVCALLVGAVWLWEWLGDMHRTIEYLSGEMAGLQGEIVSGVGDKVQKSLEAERSLITDYGMKVAAADVVENTITYDVAVNLKEGKENTKVSLMARGGETVSAPMSRGAGLSYSGQITCPIKDDTAVYLVTEEEGQSRSQLLETMYPESEYEVCLDGWVRWTALSQSGLAEDAFEPVQIFVSHGAAAGLPEPLRVRKMEIVLFRNEKQVDALPLDLETGYGGKDEWYLSGEFDVPVDVPDAQEGDTLTFALMVEDNYGRRASRILSRYTVLADGRLEYEAYGIMELDDGTYGTEVWR